MLDPFFWVDRLPDAPYSEEEGWRRRFIILTAMHSAAAVAILYRIFGM